MTCLICPVQISKGRYTAFASVFAGIDQGRIADPTGHEQLGRIGWGKRVVLVDIGEAPCLGPGADALAREFRARIEC